MSNLKVMLSCLAAITVGAASFASAQGMQKGGDMESGGKGMKGGSTSGGMQKNGMQKGDMQKGGMKGDMSNDTSNGSPASGGMTK